MNQFEKIRPNIKCAKYDWFNINVISNDCMGRDIMGGKCWESHIVNFLKQNLTSDSVFVDVGSNYGWHSIIASNLCKEVHSFEPQKIMYELQKMTIDENKIKNINLYNFGLGESNKETEMSRIDYFRNNVNIGDLSIGVGGEKIEVRTLDSFNFKQVDLIKIDVQGYEKYILDGASNIIKKFNPILIVEFEEFQLRKFGYGAKELFDIIRAYDYEIYFLEYSYPSDHVCVHKSKVNDFERKNKISILDESNRLNRNLENGVTKKIKEI